nr:RNA polymerase alpha subunit [Streptosarcina sp. YL-2023a]
MKHLLLSCIESRVESNKSFYGRFQLGPFDIGQGLTVANALRRTLLSELPGVAITAVEIEGATHEYCNLVGVRESVLDILLNVKQIVLTSDDALLQPEIGYIQVQGPAIIRAGDIKLPLSVQCVDPEQYIATISYDGNLKIKFVISSGKNYAIRTPADCNTPNLNQNFINKKILPGKIFLKDNLSNQLHSFEKSGKSRADEKGLDAINPSQENSRRRNNLETIQSENLNDNYPIGGLIKDTFNDAKKLTNIIPIDAVFMPVNKVNFMIELANESEQSQEIVILELWTNGSFHPRQAIQDASKILINLFTPFQETRSFTSVFLSPYKVPKPTYAQMYEAITLSAKKDVENFEKNLASLDIGNLDLSLRPYTCLKRANINTIADLLKKSKDDLLLLKNFGKRSLQEVETNLIQLGLRLGSLKPLDSQPKKRGI